MAETFEFTKKKIAQDRARRFRRAAIIMAAAVVPTAIGFTVGDGVAGVAVATLLVVVAHSLLER
jgi:hypothetical protein